MMASVENAQEKWCPHDCVHPSQRDEMKRTCSGPDCRMWRFSIARPGVTFGDGTFTEAIEKHGKTDLDKKGYCVLSLLTKVRTLKEEKSPHMIHNKIVARYQDRNTVDG